MIYFQDDWVTLHHARCEDVLPALPAASIDAVICDPPYGTTACAWDSPIAFDFMWRELKRLTKPTAAIVLFGSQPFTSALVMSNPGMFKYSWQWDKKFAGAFATANRRPLSVVEDVVVFYEGQCTYNPQMKQRDEPIISGKRARPRWSTNTNNVVLYQAEKKTYTEKYPTSLISIPRNVGAVSLHPTQKPQALLEYLILTYSNPGDTVLDFTSGSGTTPAAAKKLGRKCIAVEMELEYCEVTVTRLYQESMQFEATR